LHRPPDEARSPSHAELFHLREIRQITRHDLAAIGDLVCFVTVTDHEAQLISRAAVLREVAADIPRRTRDEPPSPRIASIIRERLPQRVGERHIWNSPPFAAQVADFSA
jgi:hypothetical protein